MYSDYVIKAEVNKLRRGAEALLVVVFTAENVFYSEDPKMPPAEAARILRDEAQTIAGHMSRNRKKVGNG